MMNVVQIRNNFVDDWDHLMIDLYDDIPDGMLASHGFNSVDELDEILANALDGINENGLLRLGELRNYVADVLQYFRHNLPPFYNYGEEDFEIHEDKIQTAENVLQYLEPREFAEIAQIMTPEQIMMIRSLARQKHAPEEMVREIESYTGLKPKGGMKRKKTAKRGIKKSKNQRKNKRNSQRRKKRNSQRRSTK